MYYRAMYLHLLRECDRARELLEEASAIIIAAQQACEKLRQKAEDDESRRAGTPPEQWRDT